MKTCFKCGEIKELAAFYKHPGMADGHLNKCKECNKKDVRENRAAKIDQYRAYDAARFQSDPRVKQRHERYKQTEDGKISFRKSRKKWAVANPEKNAAHIILNNAVRDKRVEKPTSCSKCGMAFKPRYIHAHHKDYGFPLTVIWLCAKCHVAEHRMDDGTQHGSTQRRMAQGP